MIQAIEDRNDRIRQARASHDPEVRAAVRGMRLVGPATLHRATLRKALNDAIRHQLITANPAVHVELPSGKRPKPVLWTAEHVTRWRRTGHIPSPVMVWTPQQTGCFLDSAAADRLFPLYPSTTWSRSPGCAAARPAGCTGPTSTWPDRP